MVSGCAIERVVAGDPTEIEMNIVVPGDTDSAMNLHAILDQRRGGGPDIGLGHTDQLTRIFAVFFIACVAAAELAVQLSSTVTISANLCSIAWNEARGRPKATRSVRVGKGELEDPVDGPTVSAFCRTSASAS
jgi:hypothetical protein